MLKKETKKKNKNDNLIPIKKGDLSKEELKKRQKNGGKRSAEVRRENRIMKEAILERLNETDWDEMIKNLILRAKDNDKSLEVLRDTIGQKPKEEVEANVNNTISINVTLDD